MPLDRKFPKVRHGRQFLSFASELQSEGLMVPPSSFFWSGASDYAEVLA